ncbi:MAG TPA: PAS domain S-box protein [Mariprofundaceae bacterium]|nr:PAS domain S-box protein [Mariprofundaceae bacterium]
MKELFSKFYTRFFRQRDLITKKFYLVISLFVVIVFCLVALDRFQANVLDAVRAYVAGEGFWSKGQKDAVYHLEQYTEGFKESEYKLFLEGLSASLGDRQARLALQSDPPDIERARQGFLDGHNHPDDIEKMIRLFLNFGEISYMKNAIAIWTEGDGLIDELLKLANEIRQEVNSGKPDPVHMDQLRIQVEAMNNRVSELENRFSGTLGDAARKIDAVTSWAIFLTALLLLLIGIALSRQIIHGIRKTQAELAASEARFRHVVESNMIGILFWSSDGTITEANDAFLDSIGYTRSDLSQGLVNWHALTPDEYASRDESALQEVVSNGFCTPFEKEYLHKDGHRVPVLLGAARFDGSEDGGVCFVLDISERKQAEHLQKIAASVFQSAKEAIFVTDATPAIKGINPAFNDITGYSEDEVLGRNPNILSSGHHDDEFYRAMWKELKEKGSWKGEVWNSRKDGQIYQGWLSISAVYDDRGNISEYVSVFSDITALRKMEDQLRQSQKMEAIGTLVGGIAHDFNNTLAAVQGNLYLAERFIDERSKVVENIQTVRKLSDHCAEMVRQLMTFARKDIVRMKPFSLTAFFREMEILIPTIVPENITINVTLCDEELEIEGDRTQLHQTILNLLNNARDALEETDHPSIDCLLTRYDPDAAFCEQHPGLQAGPTAQIIIRDNGCGIPQKNLAHVFEPFYTTKEVGKGTGLGMSMVYGSVQSHKGAIDLQSEMGKGTSVHLYLPLAVNVKKEAVTPIPVQEAKALQPSTLLLVDDNINLRTVCGEALQCMGYEVLTADDGNTALECYIQHQKRISLIITDIVMPVMGGFELVKRVRQHDATLPVIFVTGYDPEHANVPDSLMINSVILTKPFSMKALAEMIVQLQGSDR